MDRREFLTGFAGSQACSVSASLGAEFFTNARFRSQENKEVRFYEDLIKGKQVVINFMYTRCQGICPTTTANLVKVQKALKDRVGRDIFMYSISLKPQEDDPAALKEYAKAHGVKPGWLFLTGEPALIDGLRGRLFAHGHGHDHTAGPGQDCSRGLIRYGNEAIGLWGSVPTRTEPEEIVKRLSWVAARALPTGPSQRKGPPIRA